MCNTVFKITVVRCGQRMGDSLPPTPVVGASIHITGERGARRRYPAHGLGQDIDEGHTLANNDPTRDRSDDSHTRTS